MIDFTNYTENVRRAISRSYALAKEHHYPEISPLVMLAAIMTEAPDMVQYLFQYLGIDRVQFCQRTSRLFPAGAAREYPQIPLSTRLEQAFTKALAFANGTGSNVAALEHVFYALVKVDDGVKSVLNSFNVPQQKVREAVIRFREGNTSRNEDGPQTDSNSTRSLRQFATCLTEMANEGRLEPVIGRDEETRRILHKIKTERNGALVVCRGIGIQALQFSAQHHHGPSFCRQR